MQQRCWLPHLVMLMSCSSRANDDSADQAFEELLVTYACRGCVWVGVWLWQRQRKRACALIYVGCMRVHVHSALHVQDIMHVISRLAGASVSHGILTAWLPVWWCPSGPTLLKALHTAFGRGNLSTDTEGCGHVQDYSNAEVSATGTIVAGGKLGMACGDAGGTLRLFAYSQAHPQMWRGKRLLPLCAPAPCTITHADCSLA